MSFIQKLKSALMPPILVIIGLGLVVMGFGERDTSRAIADHGKEAVAQVTRVEWKEKSISKRDSGYHADITFTTEDKQTISTKISVDSGLGKRLRNDEINEIKIKYLPETPNKVVLADHTDSSSLMFGGGAALIVAGVGIFLYRRRKAKAATEIPATTT